MAVQKRTWWIAALAVLVLGSGAMLLHRPAPVEYLTAPAQRGSIKQTVEATGTLKAVQQVSVGSRVSGQLTSLNVKLGDHVRQGQLVAMIDPLLQQYSLREAQATLDSVRAQKVAKQALLKQYQLADARQKAMWANDSTSKANLEEAAASLATTQAEVDQLNAEIRESQVSVDTAKANLGYTRITSPLSGTVISIVTKEGQTVSASQSIPTIIKVADLDTMTVKAQISEADVIHVAPGMHVYFTILGDPNKRYEATLRAIEPASSTDSDSDDSSSSSSTSSSSTSSSSSSSSSSAIYYYGLFDVANPDHRLRVSMTAQVTIILGEANDVLLVPLDAIEDADSAHPYVRVLEPKGQTRRQPVQLGLKDAINVQILHGLQAGERVVLGDNSNPVAASSDHMMPPPPGP